MASEAEQLASRLPNLAGDPEVLAFGGPQLKGAARAVEPFVSGLNVANPGYRGRLERLF